MSPTPVDGRNRWLPLEPPSGADWPELRKAADEYDELRAKARETDAQLAELRLALKAAQRTDTADLAAAIRGGGNVKAKPQAAAVEAAIREAEGFACALELALDGAVGDAAEVVEQHRDEWARDAEDRCRQAHLAVLDAIDTLEEAADRLSRAETVKRWVANWPNADSKLWLPLPRGTRSVRTQNADGVNLGELLAALRETFAEVKS
jgi:hypothetical protein